MQNFLNSDARGTLSSTLEARSRKLAWSDPNLARFSAKTSNFDEAENLQKYNNEADAANFPRSTVFVHLLQVLRTTS